MKKAKRSSKGKRKVNNVSEVKKGQVTLVNFIMDRSGSMSAWGPETIQGFNKYIETLKEDKVSKYLFSLTLFNTATESRHVGVPIDTVPELNNHTYFPDGGTALHDAIGETVSEVEKQNVKADKFLVVIMTDGEENSSKNWDGNDIKKLIAKKEALGNWTFVYMGATPNAYHTGVKMGVSAGNSYNYQPAQAARTYATVASGTMNVARGGSQTMSFSAQARHSGIVGQSVTSGLSNLQQAKMTASVPDLLTEEEADKIRGKFGIDKDKK